MSRPQTAAPGRSAARLAAVKAPVTALDAGQLETVLDALDDAADYRQLRTGARCGDCRRLHPARCDDHARDDELMRRYDALSRQLRQEATP